MGYRVKCWVPRHTYKISSILRGYPLAGKRGETKSIYSPIEIIFLISIYILKTQANILLKNELRR